MSLPDWRNARCAAGQRASSRGDSDNARGPGPLRAAPAACSGVPRGARGDIHGMAAAWFVGASGGGFRLARVPRDRFRLVPGWWCRERRVGADLGLALRRRPRRARGPVRPARDGDRLFGARLFLALFAPAPRARRAPGVGRGEVLRVHIAVYGLDGGTRDGAGPRASVRVLGPHGGGVFLPDRVRPPRRGGPGLGADGAPRRRHNRRLASRRRPPTLRRRRNRLRARASRTGGTGPAPD